MVIMWLFMPPFNPYPAKKNFLNIQPFEVFSRYRDLQVIKNYSNLFNLRLNICKSSYLNSHFIPNNNDLTIKKAYFRDQQAKG